MSITETKAPDLTAREIVDLSREYTFFSWSVQSAVNPIPITRAEGVYFWDADGRRYLDFSSQLMNLNIGHQHPHVVQAIQEQAARLCFAHPSMATEVRGRLGKKIAEVTPGNLKKTFFCLGGAEANENAIKIARFSPAGTKSWHATVPITAPPTGPSLSPGISAACRSSLPCRARCISSTHTATAVLSAGHLRPATASASPTLRRSSNTKVPSTSPPSSWKASPAPTA